MSLLRCSLLVVGVRVTTATKRELMWTATSIAACPVRLLAYAPAQFDAAPQLAQQQLHVGGGVFEDHDVER
jgi:hypothetical protein